MSHAIENIYTAYKSPCGEFRGRLNEACRDPHARLKYDHPLHQSGNGVTFHTMLSLLKCRKKAARGGTGGGRLI